MKAIKRSGLSSRTIAYLIRKQAEVDKGADPDSTWKSARRTKSVTSIYAALVKMSGMRERCMYCEDSRGTDIEHFRPKSRFPQTTFSWENMLLACAGCNRKKVEQFPLLDSGEPALIDPTKDQPWEYLVFDSETGLVVSRWNAETGEPDPRGQVTAGDVCLQINIEAVTEGRLRTKRNIIRAINAFLREASAVPLGELEQALKDNDAYGLLAWYFLFDGQEDAPFCELRSHFPGVWVTSAALA